jgi:hypothetical protein
MATRHARALTGPGSPLPKELKSIAKPQFPYDSCASRRPCAEQILPKPGSLQRTRVPCRENAEHDSVRQKSSVLPIEHYSRPFKFFSACVIAT